jgi:hypothetical protein
MISGGKNYQKMLKKRFKKDNDNEVIKEPKKHKKDKAVWRLLKQEKNNVI